MTQLDDIQQTVKATHERTEEIIQWQGTIDERCKTRGETIDGMKQTLFGNPSKQDGLVGRVQCLMNNKKNQMSTREFWMGVLQKTITWAIAGAILFALYMWKLH